MSPKNGNTAGAGSILVTMPVRDIIVIGGSAGGFEAVQVLVAGLPADLHAAVFLTLHQYSRARGVLAVILNRAGRIPALLAEDGMPIEHGRIYVAPPDYHLVIQNGFMQLSHGPKENMFRPCINVMFRSAATAYEERVAGVLLTGLLDDGAAGLWEIQQHNGATIVQDPEEAKFRAMPDNAIRGLNVQYILRLREIAPLLKRLSVETQLQERQEAPENLIEPAIQACPECGGAMTKAQMGRLLEFRCHTGHRLGLKSMIAQKSSIVEDALATALSQSEELVTLLRSRSAQSPPEGLAALEAEVRRRIEEQELLRRLLDNARDASQAV